MLREWLTGIVEEAITRANKKGYKVVDSEMQIKVSIDAEEAERTMETIREKAEQLAQAVESLNQRVEKV